MSIGGPHEVLPPHAVMDTSSAGAGCPNQVSKKTVDRERALERAVSLSDSHLRENTDSHEPVGRGLAASSRQPCVTVE